MTSDDRTTVEERPFRVASENEKIRASAPVPSEPSDGKTPIFFVQLRALRGSNPALVREIAITFRARTKNEDDLE